MIIYGAVSGASIGRLFLGGFIPGIIVGVALMIPAYYTARKRYPRSRALLRKFGEALVGFYCSHHARGYHPVSW
jgi:C4-dicarboxylate transporter DctM subunit